MSVFEDKDRDRLIDCLQQINENLEKINIVLIHVKEV